MTRYHNLTMSEFIDVLDNAALQCEYHGVPISREVVTEAVNRLDECVGRFDRIEDIVKGVENV